MRKTLTETWRAKSASEECAVLRGRRRFWTFLIFFSEANSISSPYWCQKLIKNKTKNKQNYFAVHFFCFFFPNHDHSGHSHHFWTGTQTSEENFKEMLYLVGEELFLSYNDSPGSVRSFLSFSAETKMKSPPGLKLNISLLYRRCLIHRTCQRCDVTTTGSAYIVYTPWSCDLRILIKCTLRSHAPSPKQYHTACLY